MVYGLRRILPVGLDGDLAALRRGQSENIENTFRVNALFAIDQFYFGGEFLRLLGQHGGRPCVDALLIADEHFESERASAFLFPPRRLALARGGYGMRIHVLRRFFYGFSA